MVDGIVAGEQELGDGDEGVALPEQGLENGGQGLGGVEGGVVEQDDGAGGDLFRDPAGDLVGGQVLPVQAVHVPLDGLQAGGAHGADGVVVIVPVGQADEGGPHPGDRLDLVIAGGQVGQDLVGGQLGIVGVGVGVVHHLVAGVVEGLHRLRIFVHPLPHHEKGGRDLVLPQDVNELLGVLVAPGGVEADGDQLLVIPLDTVDRQLPRGGGGPHHGGGVHHPEHGGCQNQTGRRDPPLLLDEKYFDLRPALPHGPLHSSLFGWTILRMGGRKYDEVFPAPLTGEAFLSITIYSHEKSATTQDIAGSGERPCGRSKRETA